MYIYTDINIFEVLGWLPNGRINGNYFLLFFFFSFPGILILLCIMIAPTYVLQKIVSFAYTLSPTIAIYLLIVSYSILKFKLKQNTL